MIAAFKGRSSWIFRPQPLKYKRLQLDPLFWLDDQSFKRWCFFQPRLKANFQKDFWLPRVFETNNAQKKQCLGTTPPHSGCQSSSGIFHFLRFGNHDLNLPLWRLHPGSRGRLTDKMSTKNTSQRLRWKVDPNSIYTLPIQLPISTTCMGSIWGSLREKPGSHVWELLGVFRMNISKLGIRMVLAARARFGSFFFHPLWVEFLRGENCADVETKQTLRRFGNSPTRVVRLGFGNPIPKMAFQHSG